MALKDNAAAAAKKGKTMSDAEVADFTRLFTEIYKAIDSKQLRPMVRTQYMRTAFQVRHRPLIRDPSGYVALPHSHGNSVLYLTVPPLPLHSRSRLTPPCAPAWT